METFLAVLALGWIIVRMMIFLVIIIPVCLPATPLMVLGYHALVITRQKDHWSLIPYNWWFQHVHLPIATWLLWILHLDYKTDPKPDYQVYFRNTTESS